MTKTIGHVEYANDETEATELLTEYSASIGLPWGLIPQRKRDASVRVATYEDKDNGLAAAKKTLDDDVREQRHADRVKERKAVIQKQADSLLKEVGQKSDAGLLLDLCRHHYEEANHPNFTFGSGMTESEYAAFQEEWAEAAELAEQRYSQFTNLRAGKIQDKEAVGKGRSGTRWPRAGGRATCS
ncbi:hypothetical protein ACFYO9_03835 [Streptomyces sp. NPDC005863]|uniref:hypothetical protein n=1 Tax=unclassified Streptomyces TaxID=2593676 RepID=UPI0033F3516C